jgi:hydrogenase maturation factor
MCMSRLHKVVRTTGPDTAEVQDLDDSVHVVSLLALDGPAPAPGEWLVVHSGYAIDRVDATEAEAVVAELAHSAPDPSLTSGGGEPA